VGLPAEPDKTKTLVDEFGLAEALVHTASTFAEA